MWYGIGEEGELISWRSGLWEMVRRRLYRYRAAGDEAQR